MPFPSGSRSRAARRRNPSSGGSTGTIQTPTPIPQQPVTNAPPVFFEDFLGNNGQLTHVWGDTAKVSYTATTVKIAGTRDGAGVMNFPGGANTCFGNGLFEIRARWTSTTGQTGDNSGPANVIWPASDRWPGPEIDIGEIWGDGRTYYATHYRNGSGGDSATYFFVPEPFDFTQYHTYAAFLQTDKITYYMDGVVIGTETANPAPDFAHGGENHALGIMNRSSQTTMECDWVRWTPEATVLGISTTPATASISGIGRTVTEPSAGAGVDVTATITTTGTVNKISYVVCGPAPSYTWTGPATNAAQAGPLDIVPHFPPTGDVQYVKFWVNDDLDNAQLSAAVIVNPALGSGTVTAPPAASGAANLDRAGPGGGTVGDIGIIVQGQSNAYFFCDDYRTNSTDAVYLYVDMLAALTGLNDSQIKLRFSQYGTSELRSLNGGTATYSFNLNGFNSGKWLEPVGHTLNDPSTWANTENGSSFYGYVASVKNDIAAGRPWLLNRLHDEDDSKLYDSGEIAVYEPANREFIKRYRDAMSGRATNLLPVFLGPISYASSTRPQMMSAIRDAWHAQSQDATANTYHAYGSTLDAESADGGSHWDWPSARRRGFHMAIRQAKWLWANGYAVNDLAWLPTMGPRIGSFGRVTSATNTLDVTIVHDKGSDIVVPSGANVGDFQVTENGATVGVLTAARVNGTTLRLTLNRYLSNGSTVTLQYGRDLNFSGPASQITDNWHTSAITKPAAYAGTTNLGEVRMILQRTRGVLAEGSSSTATVTAPPAQSATPTGTTPYMVFNADNNNVTVTSQTPTVGNVKLVRPLGAFSNIIELSFLNTSLTPDGQPYYGGGKPGFISAQNGRVAINADVTSANDGTYTFDVIQPMSDGSTFVKSLVLTVSA